MEPTTDIATPEPIECVNDAALVAAQDTILAAAGGDASIPIHGEASESRNNLLSRLDRSELAAVSNPSGSGTIVSVVYGGDGAFEWDTAHRAGWLVLDGAAYPIDVDAAQAFERVWSGYPDEVKAAAGLGEKYWGMQAYGLSDFVDWNADSRGKLDVFLNEANGLCTTPSVWS